ncbi:MAG: hypothetical protein JOZ81_32205 [Chloroflexi bacterium]|nr:hypothetical protein [Chloroflexota bacterium]
MIFEHSVALRWHALIAPVGHFMRPAFAPFAALDKARALFTSLATSDSATDPPDPFSSETPFLTNDWPGRGHLF